MRLWHYKLLPYLPEMQFKGQFRELVAIMRDMRDTGKTNHLLINRVMEYPKQELYNYFLDYIYSYQRRYGKYTNLKICAEFMDFGEPKIEHFLLLPAFRGWHNKDYLRVCMANLYEKYAFGIGKSRISDAEWQTLREGYKNITGEDYEI